MDRITVLLFPNPRVSSIQPSPFFSTPVSSQPCTSHIHRPDKRHKTPTSSGGNPVLESAAAVVVGATAAAGLMVSGMVFPGKVAAFLSPLIPAWDASLAMVMGSALVPSTVAFQVRLVPQGLGGREGGGVRPNRPQTFNA